MNTQKIETEYRENGKRTQDDEQTGYRENKKEEKGNRDGTQSEHTQR